MIELSGERIEEILYKETAKQEELPTILRSIYTRYIHLFEKYFADIDALNDDEISKLRNYHEETMSLFKYYYMDIPEDICGAIHEFEDEWCADLLGVDWHKYLFDIYKEFKEDNENKNKGGTYIKAEFTKQALEAFYEAMEYIFRDGFKTGSKATKNMLSGLAGLLFGKS